MPPENHPSKDPSGKEWGSEHHDDRLRDGRLRFVRHGHMPERDLQTGVGSMRWSWFIGQFSSLFKV